MAFLIGTDEAGYGPNLGPLVVSATAWEVPDDWLDHSIGRNLAVRLQGCIRGAKEGRSAASGDSELGIDSEEAYPPLLIADSKVLYGPATGLRTLEYGVLTGIAASGDLPSSWRGIWQALRAARVEELDAEPWFAGYDVPIPRAAEGRTAHGWGQWLRRRLEAQSVRIIGIQSRAVFPRAFNQLIAAHGNKASALSLVTLQLVRDLLGSLPESAVLVCCDKHGGRDRYCALLQTVFSDDWIRVIQEGRTASTYRWGTNSRRIDCRFSVRGESFLPTALASMVSKYLRELAMEAFNSFWCAHVEGLRPTAGYPVDALRFRAQIRPLQSSLGISDDILWRCR
ncbi:MAG: hypothetical protein FJ295_03750 [Planctomycetes bacterium]|nr:hypothetical protein [Planctomycetota bacterium]